MEYKQIKTAKNILNDVIGKCRVPLNLQMFAEEGQSDNQEEKQGTDEKNTGNKEKENKEPDKSTPKYTDEDLDRIIGEKFAKWQKQSERKMDEAKKLAEMNAQERAEYERDEYKNKFEEMQNKIALGEMQSTARKMLSDDGINVSDKVLEMLVSPDAEKTQSAIKEFSNLFKSAVAKAVTDTLKGQTPKTGDSVKLTKEDILKIKDTKERQKAINEHLDLFM